MKRLLCLVLAIITLLSSTMDASAATKTVDLKAGACKIIKVDGDVNVKGSYDWAAIDYLLDGNEMQIYGCKEGTYDFGWTDSNGINYSYKFKVTDERVKHKKYNRLTSVIGEYSTTTFKYRDVNFTKDKNNGLTLRVRVVTNNSDEMQTPRIKIAFYDKNKKKIITKLVTRDDPYGFMLYPEIGEWFFDRKLTPEYLGITNKEFKSIKYFRILEV